MTAMRLGIASFVVLVVAGILLFVNVWAGFGALIVSFILQTLARKRVSRDELRVRRSLR